MTVLFVIAGFLLILPLSSLGQTASGILKNPWAGGLNAAQFCPVDLNLDGVMDLMVFDRHGNRILPFLSEDTIPGTTNYRFAPEYASLFPDLHDWVQIVDYNCDGRMDIFTYGLGGTRVFRNISDTSLKFHLETNLLPSYYYSGYVGILMTNVDYPAIADIDHDGDLDILTFFGLGSFVEYHKNLSVEKYGTCDSLDYRLSDKCWGDFKEGSESNQITLNITCPYKFISTSSATCRDPDTRHTGSTLLATDLNGDNLSDLLLGDVDFPQIISLVNGGTVDSAHMVSQDTVFPFNSDPVHLFSFPACSYLDVDHDGLKDIIVSPFDPSLQTAENFKSCWFYKNDGTSAAPHFIRKTDRFLQNEMIDAGSGAYPVFADMNGDGLTDLLVGNFGYYDSSYYQSGFLHSVYLSRISFYKNTGTQGHPAFTLLTDDFASLSGLRVTGLFPAAGDLDGDGDLDLIAGCSDGSLIYIDNSAGQGQDPVFGKPVLRYQGIDVGEFSTPQLFDLDKDGLPDLIIGKKNGKLSYYCNTGSPEQPVFMFITDSLGRINVTNFNLSYDGYSTPCFFRTEAGETRLVVGSEEGKLHYYTGIDGHLNEAFQPSDSLFSLVTGEPFAIKAGTRTSASITSFTNTGFLDLVVGNFSGGLNYFSNTGPPNVITSIEAPGMTPVFDFRIFPNPASQVVHIESGLPQRFGLDLYNSLGMNVFHGTSFFSQTTISIAEFQDGFYFLRIAPQGTNPFISKIIIRH